MTATFDAASPNPTYTYTEDGVYRATLTVTDVGGKGRGRHASADVDIVVGNQAPEVTLRRARSEGQPFQFGDTVDLRGQVTDDQPVDCDRVTVTLRARSRQARPPADHGHRLHRTIVTTVPERSRPGGPTT